jgi:hypothetical protein
MRLERQGDVAVVVIDNPPVNALGPGVREGIIAAVKQANADPEIRAQLRWVPWTVRARGRHNSYAPRSPSGRSRRGGPHPSFQTAKSYDPPSQERDPPSIVDILSQPPGDPPFTPLKKRDPPFKIQKVPSRGDVP